MARPRMHSFDWLNIRFAHDLYMTEHHVKNKFYNTHLSLYLNNDTHLQAGS